MTHTVKGQKGLLARVRRIKGQAESLERVLLAGIDDDCMGVLQQIAAIRGAVNGLMAEVLEGQLRDHVGDEGLSSKERSREIDQVVAVLRSYLK